MRVDLSCKKCTIKSSTCFSELISDDLDELDRNKVSRIYKKGQTIFYEDMLPSGIYCLNKGRIKIAKRGIDGKEQIVRFVLDGGFLGIRALMGERKYTASATTLEDSVVCFINKKTFLAISKKYKNISQCVLTLLCTLLEEAENKLTSIAQKPVRERLAESLLILDNVFNSAYKMKNPDNLRVINLSREDLANIVGTATETVIRLLSEFKDEKLIETEGRKIILTNINGLNNIVNKFGW